MTLGGSRPSLPLTRSLPPPARTVIHNVQADLEEERRHHSDSVAERSVGGCLTHANTEASMASATNVTDETSNTRASRVSGAASSRLREKHRHACLRMFDASHTPAAATQLRMERLSNERVSRKSRASASSHGRKSQASLGRSSNGVQRAGSSCSSLSEEEEDPSVSSTTMPVNTAAARWSQGPKAATRLLLRRVTSFEQRRRDPAPTVSMHLARIRGERALKAQTVSGKVDAAAEAPRNAHVGIANPVVVDSDGNLVVGNDFAPDAPPQLAAARRKEPQAEHELPEESVSTAWSRRNSYEHGEDAMDLEGLENLSPLQALAAKTEHSRNRKRLVRNRWQLYWMLYKNPVLQGYRSHVLDVMYAQNRQLKAKAKEARDPNLLSIDGIKGVARKGKKVAEEVTFVHEFTRARRRVMQKKPKQEEQMLNSVIEEASELGV